MKPPFRAYEIRRTDSGAVLVSPCTVLDLNPVSRTAQIEILTGSFRLKTWIAFGDLVSTPEKASARMIALLRPKELTPYDRQHSAVKPPLPVAGPAQPDTAVTAAG
ncbi:MAG: hypothetical protein PHE83_09365 [Opitutaceae bacterium]|nr:hypothetical protein [Opitutaceae bacterium]